ncbi:MAG: hypothetical protein AABZ02_04645 [Bacteroidota bacterium]
MNRSRQRLLFHPVVTVAIALVLANPDTPKQIVFARMIHPHRGGSGATESGEEKELLQKHSGTRLNSVRKPLAYPDGRPVARYRLEAKDHGIVFRHGDGPRGCDSLGARDIWVWQYGSTYYMHYDGAGAKGWLTCLATSTNLTDWTARGPALDFGAPGQKDAASASYGVTFSDKRKWHMFYLGTPHTSPPPNLVPAFPYLTMKAEGHAPTGPWTKRYDIIPFSPQPGTYYSATASPGHIIAQDGGYLMFFSASTDKPILRTLGIARTRDLDGSWRIDPHPIVPPAEQVENTSLYYEEKTGIWFLFTNHVGLRNGLEYTDAIWVYWTKNLERWDPDHKAVVLDGSNCTWSKQIIGLPSVLKVGSRLALFYDGYAGTGIPEGAASHMRRDVGLAWLELPLEVNGL